MALTAKQHRILDSVIASRGLTQSEMAAAVGVSQPHMSTIISGQRRPSASLDRRIRETLDYWDDDLYDIDQRWTENRKAAIIQQIARLRAELTRVIEEERRAG